MSQKRFLRDGIFDLLFHEARQVRNQLADRENIAPHLLHYLDSIIISYETCKIALERIEEAIDSARLADSTGEICIPLCDAANHIKSGVLSMHENLWNNLEKLRDEKQIDFSEFEALVRDDYAS
ncbi:MAG: hypothetical protein JXR73_09455 [Candidatus Omnitrophica bacterium]|nr:hypothetical protein [Candidatus Omnitrophota bacterium]